MAKKHLHTEFSTCPRKWPQIHFQKHITLAIYFLSCILIRLLFFTFFFFLSLSFLALLLPSHSLCADAWFFGRFTFFFPSLFVFPRLSLFSFFVKCKALSVSWVCVYYIHIYLRCARAHAIVYVSMCVCARIFRECFQIHSLWGEEEVGGGGEAG